MNDRPENQLKNELDLDALECVTGGAGSDGGSDGTVTACLPNAMGCRYAVAVT